MQTLQNTKRCLSILALYSVALVLSMTGLFGQDAREVIRKAEEHSRGKSSYVEMSIKIIRPNWTREMSMKSWGKGNDYMLVYVISPAKEKGSVTLKRKNEVWNWVPAIEKTIKLPPSMMMQSWMGTDLTNDDLVKQSSILEDYNHTLLEDSTLEGRLCWKVQLDPKPDAPVVWGRIYLWVDKKDFMQMKANYYDEELALVNIMSFREPTLFDGRLLPSKLEMIPIEKPGQRTVIEYSKMEFDKLVDDNFFSTQNMTRLK